MQCLQKLEFQTHVPGRANRVSVNPGYCDSLELEGVHLSFSTLQKLLRERLLKSM